MADDTVVSLVDASERMVHYSVLQMLEDMVEQVKANPEAFRNAYLLMREDNPDGQWNHHHARAGFADDVSSLGYLQIAISMRTEKIRKQLFISE